MSNKIPSSVIEIKNRGALQVGDTATFAYNGHEITGDVWSQAGRAMIGKMPLETDEEWDLDLDFVRATRPAPVLPDVPGSVIEITAIDGHTIEPNLAMLDAADDWMLAYHRDERWALKAHQITEWRPMKVVPE